ncbi:NRDE family protein [Parahaliea mediterranea]|uniref:NRDE family protein n=1 Tax=Parahaliea mediterranea TaxID=651086 RepID=A0A939DF24_9GAMM|nr:NRDE family protein [Parahaliea mediterranea]MBN7797048.1 NRDE family protein [Parahaliea mediterranea]
MCLIILVHRAHRDYPLLLAANRDEFHARPTAGAAFWDAHPDLLAGRDLTAGGTWMGVTRQGRFAAVTNFRDPARTAPAPRSRGELPLAWLTGDARDPAACLREIAARGGQYAGFNLLLGDGEALWYYSNAGAGDPVRLEPGIYGLSNASLNTPWPKVTLGKSRMAALLGSPVDHAGLLSTITDRRPARPETLHPLGLDADMDQLLSAQFILTERYGTRSSTTLIRDASGGLGWRERRYDATGEQSAVMEEQFEVTR